MIYSEGDGKIEFQVHSVINFIFGSKDQNMNKGILTIFKNFRS